MTRSSFFKSKSIPDCLSSLAHANSQHSESEVGNETSQAFVEATRETEEIMVQLATLSAETSGSLHPFQAISVSKKGHV